MQNKLIANELRNEILTRAMTASSKDEVTRSVLEVIVEARVDWRLVSAEEVKPVLVDAMRAFLRRAA